MTPKRFIAGAVCPRCGVMDKIIAYTLEGRQVRECVRCDFRDTMADDGGISEVATRVTSKPRPSDPDVQPLKFFKRPVKHD